MEIKSFEQYLDNDTHHSLADFMSQIYRGVDLLNKTSTGDQQMDRELEDIAQELETRAQRLEDILIKLD